MIDPMTDEAVVSVYMLMIIQLYVPEFETLWLLLKPHCLPRGLNSIIIGVVYHPPGNYDSALQNHITESLDCTLASYPNFGIILTGVFSQFNSYVINLTSSR